MSLRPAISNSRRASDVARCMVSLPATVVTPRICSSEDFIASASARPSSWGGMEKSVSKITLIGAIPCTCGEAVDETALQTPNANIIRRTLLNIFTRFLLRYRTFAPISPGFARAGGQRHQMDVHLVELLRVQIELHAR